MKFKLIALFALCSLALMSVSLFGQSAEVSPYAAFYWPGNNNQVGDFKNSHLLGVRAGGFVTDSFEIGGNFAWLPHFTPSTTNEAAAFAAANGFSQGKTRASLWEAEFSYNFGNRNMFGSAVRPYLVAGGGALRTHIKDNGTFVVNTRSDNTPFGTHFFPNDTLEDGDTFFTFSYGGGLKAMQLWGPLGVFGDIRGRTIPNFFSGHGTNWPEVSAGLNFSWGEH